MYKIRTHEDFLQELKNFVDEEIKHQKNLSNALGTDEHATQSINLITYAYSKIKEKIEDFEKEII